MVRGVAGGGAGLQEDGSYSSPGTGLPLLFQPWTSGRPWGGNTECVLIHLKLNRTQHRLSELTVREILVSVAEQPQAATALYG